MAELTYTTPNRGKHQILHELEIWPESSRWLADFEPNSATGNARLSPPVQLPHTSWTGARFTTGAQEAEQAERRKDNRRADDTADVRRP